MLKERFPSGRQEKGVKAPIEHIELGERQLIAPLPDEPRHVQHLVPVGWTRPLGRKPDYETFNIPPETQEQAFASKIDGRNLDAMLGPDDDERICGEPAYRLVDRRAAEPGEVLDVLHRKRAAGPQLAMDNQVLDPLVRKASEVDPAAPPGVPARSDLRLLGEEAWA
jgi:hypothetical protein